MASAVKPFPNPLVVQLLSIAEELAGHKGRYFLRQTAMRRAISSAYYAVFHALCFICSLGLSRRAHPDLRDQIYRALDHGTAKRRLADREIAALHPSLPAVGSAFRVLQDQRHLADYAPPSHAFTPGEVMTLIGHARTAVGLLRSLDPEAQARLAVALLIARRPT